MHAIALAVIYFFIYAFLGWVQEFIYFLVTERRIKTTSFLRMPILPIYGIGAMAILWLISPYIHNPFLVFVLSAVAATIIEYVGHVLIEKLFHIQLWNYDHKKFNFQGRVALDNSIGFGILALLLVYVIHPFVSSYVEMLPDMLVVIVGIVLFALLVVDFANSAGSLTKLRFSKIRTTLVDIQAGITERLAMLVPSPRTIKTRLRRTRVVLLKLYRANLRRLSKAFPQARFSRAKVRTKRRRPV